MGGGGMHACQRYAGIIDGDTQQGVGLEKYPQFVFLPRLMEQVARS